MSAHECTVTKLQTLIHDLPELVHISLGRTSNVNKVDRYNTLIETSVILRLVRLRINIRCQEASASHTGIAVSLTVLIHFEFLHLLLGDVIRNHALRGAFCCEFG